MSFFEIVLIAIGLSMDAFAVSVTLGLSVKKLTIRQILIPGIYFGLFQALMPIAGYFAGVYFADRIQNLDHWIAFILLTLIGAKMIKESFSNKEENIDANSFQPPKMILLALATSIDALGVGVTFAFFEINIFEASALIGLITFCLSAIGAKIGNIFGAKLKSKAEFIGGAIPMALGTNILIEHLFF